MNTYKRINQAIAKVAELICMLAITGMVVMIVAELFNRNILNNSFRASIEICGILFLWMAFIGLIPLYCNNGLMRLDFLITRTNGLIGEGLYLLNKLVSLMLGITMIVAFWAQYPFISTRTYATLQGIPYTVQYIPMCIAGIYIVIKTVEQLIEWVIHMQQSRKNSG